MPLHATPYNPFFSHDWIEPWVCQIDVLYKKGKSYLLRFYCLYGQLTPHTLQLLEEGEEGKVQPNLRMKLEVPLQVCHVKISFMGLAIPFFYCCGWLHPSFFRRSQNITWFWLNYFQSIAQISRKKGSHQVLDISPLYIRQTLSIFFLFFFCHGRIDTILEALSVNNYG